MNIKCKLSLQQGCSWGAGEQRLPIATSPWSEINILSRRLVDTIEVGGKQSLVVHQMPISWIMTVLSSLDSRTSSQSNNGKKHTHKILICVIYMSLILSWN